MVGIVSRGEEWGVHTFLGGEGEVQEAREEVGSVVDSGEEVWLYVDEYDVGKGVKFEVEGGGRWSVRIQY